MVDQHTEHLIASLPNLFVASKETQTTLPEEAAIDSFKLTHAHVLIL